jgi:hypothetical protein
MRNTGRLVAPGKGRFAAPTLGRGQVAAMCVKQGGLRETVVGEQSGYVKNSCSECNCDCANLLIPSARGNKPVRVMITHGGSAASVAMKGAACRELHAISLHAAERRPCCG